MCIRDRNRHGVAIGENAPKKLVINGDLTWENLERNRKEWLNLISQQEFLNKFNDPNYLPEGESNYPGYEGC